MVAKLHIHLHAVHLEDTDITELADFVEVEEFHATCAFVEVVFEEDATVPVLDFAVACPEGEVDWFGNGRIFLRMKIWMAFTLPSTLSLMLNFTSLHILLQRHLVSRMCIP